MLPKKRIYQIKHTKILPKRGLPPQTPNGSRIVYAKASFEIGTYCPSRV